MRFVAPSVDPETARSRLAPRSWPRVRAPRDRGPLADVVLPHLELVWLPFLHATAPLASSERSAPGPRLGCLVCATSGLASRVEHAAQRFVDAPVERLPPTAIGRGELERRARAHLGRIARLAGATLADRPEALGFENWALPFWVLHYERRPGRLDFSALDAVTGERVGGAVRQALLRAMTADPLGSAGPLPEPPDPVDR